MSHKIIFMGTPEFSVPTLRVLSDRHSPDNVLVVTQPDRSAGRGRKLQAPPVRRAGDDLGLNVIQTSTMKDPVVRARLTEFAPDLIVVAAFGLILPGWVLSLPRQGCINLHASELPRFRGASPVAAAIAMGDSRTAITLMQMERGLDTGGVYATEGADIAHDATTESLTAELATMGAGLLDRNLSRLLAGEIDPKPQSGTIIETRKIVKAHGAIDWEAPARMVERHVRAMWSWPRAWTLDERRTRVQVHAAKVVDDRDDSIPGTVIGHDARGVLVATGDGVLCLVTVQLPGKSALAASKLVQHPAFAIGSVLGQDPEAEDPGPWIVETGEV